MLSRLSVVLVACSLASSASALEFTKHDSDGDTINAVKASGEIVLGDAFRFVTFISRLPQKKIISLHLSSTGGSVQEAMAIGREVYKFKVRTYVTDEKANCSSACAIVFMGGRDAETNGSFRIKGINNALRVHNFKPILAADKEYTIEDAHRIVARAQKSILDLALYYDEVDVDPEWLGITLKQKELYSLKNQEALNMGIDILDPKTGEITRATDYKKLLKAR